MSFRIPVARPWLSDRELQYVTDTIQRNEISSGGRYVVKFEEAFARFCGVPHALSACNGTAALHLALVGVGVGPGDEVIVPALTFVATAAAVVHAGAKPVFADVNPTTWCVTAATVRARLNRRTKAVIAVHLYGHPCDMDELAALPGMQRVHLIEDAAEAHGATVRGRPVGSIGRLGIFSFYGNKNFTTGEGGAITGTESALFERLRQLRGHGADPTRRYWHPVIGYNYRMTALQAAVGLAQVERGPDILARKSTIMLRYRAGLRGLPLTYQETQTWATHANWLMCVVFPDDFHTSVSDIRATLEDQGIETRPFFPVVADLPPYVHEGEYPVARDLARRGINLPSGPAISDAEVDEVCAAVRRVCEGN